MQNLKPGKYRHFRGNFYRVLGVARNTETKEYVVVYEPLYDSDFAKLMVRPLAMFTEEVEVDGKKVSRFEYVGD